MRTHARFVLRGSTHVSLRLLPHHLSLADGQGRLLALDLESEVLIRDLRIEASQERNNLKLSPAFTPIDDVPEKSGPYFCAAAR